MENDTIFEEESSTEGEDEIQESPQSIDIGDQFSPEEIEAANELHNSLRTFLSDVEKIEQTEDEIQTTISTGIDVLDALLGGGVGTSFVEIVGQPGAGKSALAARLLATAQRKYLGKFIGVYLDSEEVMTKERLAQLGVNHPKITPITKLSVEKVFKIIEGICAFKEEYKKKDKSVLDTPSIVIWDSIANTQAESGLVVEDPNKIIGLKARLLSFYLPKYVQKLNKYNISLVAINQLRDKLDMGQYAPAPTLKFLADKSIPGGNAPLFNAVQLLYLQVKSDLKEVYGFNGISVKGRLVKNKLFTPNIDFLMLFSYERGFSNFWTNYELLKEYKRISAAAWCTLNAYPGKKFRQKDAIKFYREDPQFREIWDSEVKDVIDVEYIQKYKSSGDSELY